MLLYCKYCVCNCYSQTHYYQYLLKHIRNIPILYIFANCPIFLHRCVIPCITCEFPKSAMGTTQVSHMSINCAPHSLRDSSSPGHYAELFNRWVLPARTTHGARICTMIIRMLKLTPAATHHPAAKQIGIAGFFSDNNVVVWDLSKWESHRVLWIKLDRSGWTRTLLRSQCLGCYLIMCVVERGNENVELWTPELAIKISARDI